MMNVRDFIAQVLQDVVNGILDAQKEIDPSVALVSPPIRVFSSDSSDLEGVGGDVQTIQFDIAVTATDSKGTIRR